MTGTLDSGFFEHWDNRESYMLRATSSMINSKAIPYFIDSRCLAECIWLIEKIRVSASEVSNHADWSWSMSAKRGVQQARFRFWKWLLLIEIDRASDLEIR